MTATIINLRQARKDRARDKRSGIAAEQRARFGRGKADREKDAALGVLQQDRLDGSKLSGSTIPAERRDDRSGEP